MNRTFIYKYQKLECCDPLSRLDLICSISCSIAVLGDVFCPAGLAQSLSEKTFQAVSQLCVNALLLLLWILFKCIITQHFASSSGMCFPSRHIAVTSQLWSPSSPCHIAHTHFGFNLAHSLLLVPGLKQSCVSVRSHRARRGGEERENRERHYGRQDAAAGASDGGTEQTRHHVQQSLSISLSSTTGLVQQMGQQSILGNP